MSDLIKIYCSDISGEVATSRFYNGKNYRRFIYFRYFSNCLRTSDIVWRKS